MAIFPIRSPGRARSWSTPWPRASTAPIRRWRAGDYKQTKFPLILGRDFSGKVSAVGAGVSDLKVGDEVFGVLETGRDGTYCEKIAVGANVVGKKPAGLSHVDAAAMALTGLTAICSVEDSLQAQGRRDHPDPGRRGRRRGLRHPARQAHRRARHQHLQHRQSRLCAGPRRRRGHRLQDHRLHQGREELRRGVRDRGRRRRDALLRGPQARRARGLHRLRRAGAQARAQRRDRARGRPCRASAQYMERIAELHGGRRPSAACHAVRAWRRRARRCGVSAARHFKGKLVLKVR